MTAQHSAFCAKNYPACLCITCTKDHKATHTVKSCCGEHFRMGDNCPCAECKDYVKEGDTSHE